MIKRTRDANQDKTQKEIDVQIFEDCLRQEAVFYYPQTNKKDSTEMKLEK